MYKKVLDFWFKELKPEMWWRKDRDVDASMKVRFGALHQQAVKCELVVWRNTPMGALAEIIVVDQFSRNIYRDRPESFASDPLALALAQTAVDKGFDKELPEAERSFVYMPYMHSESGIIHEEAVKLFTRLGNSKKLEFELKHKAIIDKFGRYPHRNRILGRQSTSAEIEFLKEPGSSF